MTAPRPARLALRAVRYGAAMLRSLPAHARRSRRAATPLPRRVWEQWRLLRRTGITVDDYYLNALDRAELPWARKTEFLGDMERRRWQAALNPDAYTVVTQDKVVFKRLMAHAGLPVPRLLGVVGPDGRAETGEPLGTDDEVRAWLLAGGVAHVVFKPVLGTGGAGVLALGARVPGAPRWRRLPAGEVAVDEILTHLRAVPVGRHFLAEARLWNHATLCPFGPDVLHTVRAITVLESTPTIVAATLRIGLGHVAVDNLEQGNLGAPVDVQSGRLGAASLLEDGRITRRATHPRTGARIEGAVVPDWAEARAVLERAAQEAAFNPVLGWDVALTPDGPVVIEANDRWHPQACQVAQDQGLLATALGPYLERRGLLTRRGLRRA